MDIRTERIRVRIRMLSKEEKALQGSWRRLQGQADVVAKSLVEARLADIHAELGPLVGYYYLETGVNPYEALEGL